MGKKIIIAGGGFAGLTAFDYLTKRTNRLFEDSEITLVDKKDSFDFLPIAPDVLAGWLYPRNARIDLRDYARGKKQRFVKGNIQEIDPSKNMIKVDRNILKYDYLILATGSEPNFFGNKNVRENCLTLNSVEDSLRIKSDLISRAKTARLWEVVVVGGGYTGLEAALNAHFLLKHYNVDCSFTVVEKAPSILGMVPEDIRLIATDELKRLGIGVLTNESLERYEDNTAYLASGKTISNAVCIWSAGVRTPSFLEGFEAEKVKTRIKVNPDLTIKGSKYNNVFIAGDTAAFMDEKGEAPLRMAIMFAIGQAKTASRNIINSMSGRKTEKYVPRDLGYLIPLVYGKAPGIVLGRRICAHLGYLLHYAMCVYRSKPRKIPGLISDIAASRILGMRGK